jgi:DNA topoisomerase-1
MAAKQEQALVIVESPTKAKTITRFLGNGYVVRASMGHVRDLPDSAAEIPAHYKKESWARLGVNVEKNFEPLYVVPKGKKDQVRELKQLLKDADKLYLATDEDREGESISWHLHEVLKPKVPTRRLVFNEITKEAILESLESARDIDEALVRAQETRRIVDRLFGYEVSPLLWKKIAPGSSAGRVQSVAVRLLVERERARIRFRPAEYWAVRARLRKPGAEPAFDADLVSVGGKRIATAKDFDPDTGRLADAAAVITLSEAEAMRVKGLLEEGPIRVKSVEQKPFTQRPAAPFVTSSLQMEANSKLRYSAKRTMQIAQQLYENGFITYMRTDSTALSDEAIRGARALIEREYGREYMAPYVRQYDTKVKNAQEAHEAIRPASDHYSSVDAVRAQLGDDAARLYDLIFKRTVACQMADAKGTNTVALTEAGDAVFRSTGKTIEFAGFLKAYAVEEDDENSEPSDRVLPAMAEGDSLNAERAEALDRFTQPPNRFTEGSLIRELERLGIGRPSTWASIVELVLSRSYAFKKGTALVPTFTAMALINLLEKHFHNLVDYSYTARLEDDLDAISLGQMQSLDYLRRFYYGEDADGLRALIAKGEAEIDPKEINGISLGTFNDRAIEVRIGRYGPFVSDGERRASVPDDTPPDELTAGKAWELLDHASRPPDSLGTHPETNEPVYLKVGRYGPYVQLSDASPGAKPKMASLLPGTELSDVDLEHALKLLELPRTLGKHPETGEPVVASNGRFGPYVQAGKEFRSLPADLTPIDVTLEQAVHLLSQPKSRGRGAAKMTVLKDLGTHAESGKHVRILSGRFGPYITDGETNASVPRGTQPLEVTMERAQEILAQRRIQIEEQGGVVKRPAGRRRGTRKTAQKAAKG